MKTSILLIFLVLTASQMVAQQVPDPMFNPVIPNPIYQTGKGSMIFIDEGHHSGHTKDRGYLPFARILEKDGYVVKGYAGEFDKKKLANIKVLVIANPLNAINVKNWTLPTPSAFTKEEIEAVENWVYNGGSLFLIADHMPFAGAAEELASVFGFKFYNGFNFDIINPSYFKLTNKTLVENIITKGRDSTESVIQIPNTEGQAFLIPADANPILVFNNSSMMLMPDTAWRFHNNTPLLKIRGWSQGAFKKHGKGKIVAFGEASMFTAQLGGPDKRKMGMNREDAKDSYKLLLNIIH
ncbi:MAG: DUF4350 domain-containing protein [Cyclobacteriaceae bacterium]